jgi:hypothetical protein
LRYYVPLFNDHIVGIYNELSEMSGNLHLTNKRFNDLLREMVKDFEDLKDHVIVYDEELLSRFSTFIDFLEESKIGKTEGSLNSIYGGMLTAMRTA